MNVKNIFALGAIALMSVAQVASANTAREMLGSWTGDASYQMTNGSVSTCEVNLSLETNNSQLIYNLTVVCDNTDFSQTLPFELVATDKADIVVVAFQGKSVGTFDLTNKIMEVADMKIYHDPKKPKAFDTMAFTIAENNDGTVSYDDSYCFNGTDCETISGILSSDLDGTIEQTIGSALR